jgi:stage V sporulation protein B
MSVKDIFVKPFISALGMGISARLAYIGLIGLVGGKLGTILAIIIGAIVYVILLVLTGSITSEDLNLLPKGDKIAKRIDKFKIIK